MPSTLLRSIAFALAALAAACGSSSGTAVPGHDGPVPSPAGQRVLADLAGARVVDVGGGEWAIGPFGVVPNPVSAGGKGPAVRLDSDSAQRWIPVERDGDVADLYLRARGSECPDVAGETSAAYRAAWRP